MSRRESVPGPAEKSISDSRNLYSLWKRAHSVGVLQVQRNIGFLGAARIGEDGEGSTCRLVSSEGCVALTTVRAAGRVSTTGRPWYVHQRGAIVSRTASRRTLDKHIQEMVGMQKLRSSTCNTTCVAKVSTSKGKRQSHVLLADQDSLRHGHLLVALARD